MWFFLNYHPRCNGWLLFEFKRTLRRVYCISLYEINILLWTWTYLSCPVVHTRPECLSSQGQMICHIHRINKQQIRYADPSNHVATLKMESFLECLGQSLVEILGLTESSSRSLGRSRHELNSASFLSSSIQYLKYVPIISRLSLTWVQGNSWQLWQSWSVMCMRL